MPKIIGGSLHEHREQTRLRLFGALSRLMGERGFDAITLADIAQAAGVGRTAVYNHFADKESMLVGFILHETEQYVAALEAELAGVDDPTAQLRAYVRAQCELKRDYHLAPGPDLRSVLSRGTQQRVREHVVLVESLLRRILAAGIESGEFPEQDLGTTVSLVNACLSSRGLPDDPEARERAVESTVLFVLRAVGAGERAEVAAAEPVPA
ncbi:TetR/AcrR family transcriptional regulator [Cellulomonas sp. C5510]|uniref:TetR/AcrR family transcriptional regulator n=1 Tax=Cellulomonas sp. C5510 TaxID=2871170 RepID=UPI001C956B12|nr:TetR/AcrR family transcriptional regulator [Cellulomonas sp. C5510]QZN85557.1 TetR/AcrR family transcriptional regulator [Cellulomonas sp. C5510]